MSALQRATLATTRPGMSTSTFRRVRLLLALFILVAAIAFPAASHQMSFADEVDNPTEVQLQHLIDSDKSGKWLPLIRWDIPTIFTHADSGWFDTGKLLRAAPTSITNVLLEFGDSLWQTSVSLVVQSLSFNMWEVGGATVDNAVGSLVGGLLGVGGTASIIFLLLVSAIVSAVWKGRKTGSMTSAAKEIGAKIVLLAAVTMMAVGATNSTTIEKAYNSDPSSRYQVEYTGSPTGEPCIGNYCPGKFSPGWLIMTAQSAANGLLTGDYLTSVVDSIQGPDGDSGTNLTCDALIDEMHEKYAASVKNSASSGYANIPLLISQMWEDSGLQVWRYTQFGMGDEREKLDKNAYCRLREFQSTNHNPSELLRLTQDASGASGGDAGSIAFNPGPRDDRTSASVMGWVICDPVTGGLRPEAREFYDPKKEGADGPAQHCTNWYTDSTDRSRGHTDALYFGSDDTPEAGYGWDIDDDTEAYGFLMQFHGFEISSQMGVAAIYSLSSLTILGVFGMVALLGIFAKVALFVIAGLGALLLLIAFVPGVSPGEKAKELGVRTLGMVLITFLITVLLSILAMITRVLATVGESLFGGFMIAKIAWIAISPFLALLVLNWVFKRVLKVSSPLSLSGAMAWGSNPSAIGKSLMTGAAAGVGSFAGSRGGVASALRRQATSFARDTRRMRTFAKHARSAGGAMDMQPRRAQTGLRSSRAGAAGAGAAAGAATGAAGATATAGLGQKALGLQERLREQGRPISDTAAAAAAHAGHRYGQMSADEQNTARGRYLHARSQGRARWRAAKGATLDHSRSSMTAEDAATLRGRMGHHAKGALAAAKAQGGKLTSTVKSLGRRPGEQPENAPSIGERSKRALYQARAWMGDNKKAVATGVGAAAVGSLFAPSLAGVAVAGAAGTFYKKRREEGRRLFGRESITSDIEPSTSKADVLHAMQNARMDKAADDHDFNASLDGREAPPEPAGADETWTDGNPPSGGGGPAPDTGRGSAGPEEVGEPFSPTPPPRQRQPRRAPLQDRQQQRPTPNQQRRGPKPQ